MKKVALFLVLFTILPGLFAISAQASGKSIEPDTVRLTLKCGQSAQIEKTVIVPPLIPKGDIVFAFDLTGSMQDELTVAKAQAYNIMVAIAGLVTDPKFAVVSYMDYPHFYDTCGYAANYGYPPLGDYAYSLDQSLTSDTALVRTAIQGLVLGGGYDGPQDYERIFFESYADSVNIGYRLGAKKILINIGDCIPHDCNLNEGFRPGVWSTGGDPGRDEIMGNADDIDLQTALSGMAARGISLLEIHGSTNCDSLDHWKYWCSLTGGQFFLLADSSQIPAAVESLIEAQVLYIDSLYLQVMTPGFESWLASVVPPYYLDFTAPETLYFTETIQVPPESSGAGSYVFQISAIGDGASYGDEIVIVEVPANQPPSFDCPDDDSVHAGDEFVSTDFFVTDPDGDSVTVVLCGITPSPINPPSVVDKHIEWQTTCEDTGKTFTICLEAADICGATDTCHFQVTVYNRAPQITCPEDDSLHAGDNFISTDFSVTDPDSDVVTVSLCGITPPPINPPSIVGNHVEWQTACADAGKFFTICLQVTDSCGAKDTCYFQVTVYNRAPQITCPEDDSLRAGDKFISTDFSVIDPDNDSVTVSLCGMTPPPTNPPSLVDKHIEWQSACEDAGKIFTICLLATDSCGATDTCHFQVTVYNRAPQITCPEDDSLHAGDNFISTDFSVTDPDSDVVTVSLCGITPPPTNPPSLVDKHIEWQSACADAGKFFTICLQVTDSCGANDTCYFQVTVYNQPPVLTCPDDDSVHAGDNFISTDFSVTDPDSDVVTVSLCGMTPPPTNPPSLVDKHIEWQSVCEDAGKIFTICLLATDSCGAKDTCYFQVTVYNHPPVFTSVPASNETLYSEETQNYTFTADDPDGDKICSMNISVTSGWISNVNPNIPPCHTSPVTVTFIYHAPEVEESTDVVICFMVDDSCGLEVETEACFIIHVIPRLEKINQVRIPNRVYERFGFGHWDYFPWDGNGEDNYIILDDACPPYNGINPGDFFEIPIILQGIGASSPDSIFIGGFEIEVDFDYVDLTFYGADRGGLLSQRWYEPYDPNPTDSVLYSWEYFTYRVLPCVTCACCKYKIELYGQGEMPDGQLRRGYYLGEPFSTHPKIPQHTWWYIDKDTLGNNIGATLAWLKFQVANNELLRDLKLPIVFEWEHKLNNEWPYHIIQDWDCAENTMSDSTGYKLYVSSDPMQYAPGICPETPYNLLNFVDGGVHICSPCTAFTCVRGDINMNQITYEVADAVLFARYFVYGINVFTIDRNKQICATDVNADGRTLMLADLIYLIRVIQHDAVPFPKLGPSSDVANLIVSDGNITVECASSVGGLLFEFDGSVNATLLNTDMEMLSNQGKVLVWSSAGNSINAGASQILNVSGANLTSVIAVDREGRELATTINAKVTPTTFALHPAYPNPFNPATNLSFTLPTATPYSLSIYNVAGQLVRTYEGTGNVGLNVITWDGKDKVGVEVASGVYFYKLTAGQYHAINKMVMLK